MGSLVGCGLGGSIGLPLDFCECALCFLVGGADFFSLFAFSCRLIVCLSSVDCSFCV